MSNFLPLPTKRATPIPDLGPKLLSYITTNFRDAHPEAFKRDVGQFVALRREWVEGKGEAHPEGVKGLMRYHAQLAFLVTKFPRDIGVAFAYHTPFPPPFSLTPDSPIPLNSLTFERASVLYNVAALYATMAAAERRAELEGIKRALGYLTSAAGVLAYLISSILPAFKNELPTPNAAGYDMTESFLCAMREFVLAQAQECFWQQAVMQGSYKDPIVAKLSMKVSEYYKSALTFANSQDYPSAAFLPANWTTHITIKQIHFEAAAQYRMSKEDVNKSRYGVEISRLRVAEGLAKKGLSNTRGVAESVISDLKDLQNAVKSALERAVRENDLIYVSPVPPANQLDSINGAGMVKLVTPPEIAEPVEWLMKGGAGIGPLFSGLVPYGVHLALSVYDDRKDTLVRELDSRREELDGLAASTLQSLSLPGSIQALDRPIGLPPSLLKKAEEVDAGGGTRRIEGLLDEVARLSKANRKQLEEAMDILDDEATENDTLIERRPDMASSRSPSHIANAGLIQTAQQYEATVKAAGDSDATVRRKWEEWESRIAVLADEDDLKDYIPSTTSPSSLPASVRPLRASLEELDDRIANRARIIQDARSLAQADDIRPQVLAEAGRMAHGGSGDVRTEWFEGIFDKGLEKYEDVKAEMAREGTKQEALLERIRIQNETFLSERKDDPRVRAREQALQEMDAAFWKWRELIENLTEGVGFYNNLAEILRGFKVACGQFLNSRRADVGQITNGVQHMGLGQQQPQHQQHQSQHHTSYQQSPQQQHHPEQRYQQSPSYASPPPQTFSPGPSFHPSPQPYSPSPPPPQPPAQRQAFLPHPSSATWQDAPDFLPPPPPQPILRSGGIATASTLPATSPRRTTQGYEVDTPKRITRSQAQPKGPIGDAERNPYKGPSKSRRDGGVV